MKSYFSRVIGIYLPLAISLVLPGCFEKAHPAPEYGIADFNGDGTDDRFNFTFQPPEGLYECQEGQSRLNVEILDSKGKITKKGSTELGNRRVGTIQIADLNGDDNLDLLLSSTSCGKLLNETLLGDGKGNFQLKDK